MLFQDKVCLAVDITDLAKAQAVARDFRSCTRTVKLGPALCAAQGPMGIRSFYSLGMSEVILDLRLCGRAWEMRTAISAILSIRGTAGVTVQACSGRESMSAALQTAAGSILRTNTIKPPKVLATLSPSTLTDAELAADHCISGGRREYVQTTVRWCREIGVHGVIVDYYDIQAAKEACPDMPLLANAKRGVATRLASIPASQRKLPGVGSVIRAGACHAFFDAVLVARQDHDWAADTLQKEMKSTGIWSGHGSP
ncbi:MAG: orotidine 5'-phosphate decarboxylase / HUMPS family protein [Patescibacteria group bacterium]